MSLDVRKETISVYSLIIMEWSKRGCPPGFTCWISFAPVFSFIYC